MGFVPCKQQVEEVSLDQAGFGLLIFLQPSQAEKCVAGSSSDHVFDRCGVWFAVIERGCSHGQVAQRCFL